MNDFDPANHRMLPQRFFEDFTLGERFVLPSRTMTDAIFLAFQAASGDNHPVHYDVEFCKARGMPGLLAHGFQAVIQTAPGAGMFPFMVEDSLMGFLEQSSKFLKPVFAGDTLVEDGCTCDRTLPISCSLMAADGTWGPLEDDFAGCNGDDTCGGGPLARLPFSGLKSNRPYCLCII